MRKALLLLAVIALCHAGGASPKVDLPELGFVFVGAAVLLSTAFIAIAYMVSSAFQNPQAIAWSKNQLRELIVGVFIVVLVVGAYVAANELISSMTGYPNAVELGEDNIRDILAPIEKIYKKVGEAYFTLGQYQGSSTSYVSGNLGYIYYHESKSPYYGVSPVMGSLNQQTYQLTMQILSFRFLLVLLQYIDVVVPNFLLPLGMAFRVFPFTKKIGNTLIALALGALFMLPASLLVVDEMRKAITFQHVDAAALMSFQVSSAMGEMTGSATGDALYSLLIWPYLVAKETCEIATVRTFFSLGEIVWGVIYATLAAIKCLAGYAACWVIEFNFFVFFLWPWIMFFAQNILAVLVAIAGTPSAGFIYDLLVADIVKYLFPAVSELTTFSIMSIIVIAVITFTGTRSISVALGGEYALSGLSRLI